MAFYPNYYNPNNFQNYVNAPMQTPPQQNSIIWVQGESGAKSYMVAPNTTVQLWDSESQTIYLKSADASGMPSIRVLDYTFRDGMPAQQAEPDYATRADLDALRKEIEELRRTMEV